MDNNRLESLFRGPDVPLKLAFYVHLILLSWAMLSEWSPSGYFFYNVIFLLLLLWGIAAKDSSEPLEMAQIVNFICLVFDIFVVCIYFPGSDIGKQMSAVMAILNFILRQFTVIILRNEILWRSDRGTSNFPNTFASQYQDIGSVSP